MTRRRLSATKDDYRLLSIADAFSCINQRVNLIGVIIEHSLPQKSQGSDYWCLLKIVDASYHRRGLVINLFAESMDLLPKVESAGVIIQLSQVVIKAYHNEINASFYKNSSAFALYEGKHGQSFTPYQVSSNFCSREQDKIFVADLRTWMDSAQLRTVSNDSILLREIQNAERVDLFCKIVHVCEDNQGEWMLFVWDGTDAPPCHIQEKLDNEKESPLPLQLEGKSLSRDTLSKFPTVGTVLRVKVQLGLDPSTLIAGKWVNLIGLALGLQLDAGLWYGVFASGTRIKYIQDGHPYVLNRLSEYDERLSAKWDRMPFTCFPWPGQVTETIKDDVSVSTLMDIMNYSQVTAKFRCIVRVVAMLPSDPKDFRSPSGTYRIRLTLEDPTTRIHAYLYAEDAEMFFDEYPDIDALTRKRNKFLGIGETENAPRNPPWMLCCIKSYYLDEANKWESRNYRIFGTRVLCE